MRASAKVNKLPHMVIITMWGYTISQGMLNE